MWLLNVAQNIQRNYRNRVLWSVLSPIPIVDGYHFLDVFFGYFWKQSLHCYFLFHHQFECCIMTWYCYKPTTVKHVGCWHGSDMPGKCNVYVSNVLIIHCLFLSSLPCTCNSPLVLHPVLLNIKIHDSGVGVHRRWLIRLEHWNLQRTTPGDWF